jgi:tetratricopeptide (TPR) repeat protein
MWRARSAILLAVLSLGFAVPMTSVQEQEENPPREAAEEARPYSVPPAWKSVEIGNFYLRRKKYKAALSRYQEAAKTDPHYAPAYLGLGRVYEKIGLRQKALEAYQKYLDELPSSKDALEAREVQKAVARLERQLKVPGTRSRRPSPSPDAGSPPR